MLPFYLGPNCRFGRKVVHKPNGDFVLDSASIGVSGYEVTQHPVSTISAGLNPQASTLKPRHLGRLLSWRGRLPWVVYTAGADCICNLGEPKTPDLTLTLPQRISGDCSLSRQFQQATWAQAQKFRSFYGVNERLGF